MLKTPVIRVLPAVLLLLGVTQTTYIFPAAETENKQAESALEFVKKFDYNKKEEKMVEKKTKPTKVDLKKQYKALYSPTAKTPEIVEVPAFKYIKIDGQGNPNQSKEFQEKVQLLYGLSYTLKFMLKKDNQDPFDFTVAPLSGLWWCDDMSAFTEPGRKDEWKWTLMIMQPDRVTTSLFEKAKEELIKKKNPPFNHHVCLEIYEEGLCAQIMHLGPYDKEGPTIKKLHDFIQEKGYVPHKQHHEIYLGDPRKAKPEKLRTIIRQPIKKK